MSLKSIGNVSAILKEIAVSGSISKATFDSLNLSLQGLNEAQIAATVSLSGLSAEQVASSLKASGFTATQTAATMATLQFSEQATMAAMSAAGFEKAQIKDAVAATTFTAAETAATAATGGLSAAMSGLTAVMAANPFMIAVTAISLLIAIVPMAINLFNKFHKTTEELKQEYDDLASELDGLNSELKTTKDRIAELQKLSDEGRITLVEQEELDRLLETNAQLERQIRLKNEAAQEAADKSNKSLVKDYNNEYYNSNAGMYMLFDADAIRANNAEGFKALEEWHNGWSENWDKFSEEEQERLINLYSEYQNLMLEGNNKLQYPEQLGFDDYVDQLIARYKELEGLGQNATDSQIAEMASIRSELLSLSQTLQNDYIDNFVGDGDDVKNWNNLADAIDACINPAEHFTSLLEKLPNDLKDVLNSEGSEGGLTAERINELAGQYQELAKWMEDSGYTAYELASHYNALKVETDSNAESTGRYSAQLSDLTETLSDLQSAYDVLATAQEEMAGGGGLSPDTIADLAEAEANYLDYLYEENGVIKLNTEAWKENANTKMLGDIDEIQKEISSLEERNEVLAQSLEMYRTNKSMSIGDTSSIAAWDKKIKDTTDEINANTEAIAANQAKLTLYSSLYGSITGDTNAYASALNNFINIANTIDSVSDSFQTLADLQAQVANGFTMSLDKALEFAKVYPEILNNAQVSSNGQIALNKEVVNSFLTSKKKELDTQIDTQIAELQADKTVLEAKMQAAQAQLELAKNVGEGEGQVAKEVAEYRIKASNEMVQALIDNGIDEAEAYKLAAQSMALNAEEFDRVARDVCTDVDGNFNAAAYNAAMGIYENMERAKTDIASVAKQAHESAKAIEGMANGVVKGSVTKFAGSFGGKLRDKIKTNITSGEFNGFDFDFDFKGASLEDFVSQVELDISSYQKAISQIDGQIAALQALKNAPLKNFKSGSGSSTKEIEEYIAAIDDYREAIERLNRVQIKKSDLETQLLNTNDLRTQIELQQELIGVYKEEQDALHDLNELRDQTIKDGTESLRQLGFDVEYDPDKNNFFVKNLEHLNELTADSKGKYGSLQEATNALRKDTESLINTLGELNKANQENSDSWVELAYKIQEANIAIYENTAKEHENAITKNENLLNHAIESNDRGEITRNTGEIVDHYRAMQEAVRQEAEYYRSLGYADTSDEITKLEDLWWDYYDEIKTVSADAWQQVVDNAHDALDQITGLYDTLKDAAKEFSESGYITVSTFQEIAKLGVENLAYLQDENGMLVINEENIQKVIAARTQQMAIETALNYVQQLRQALADNDVVALMNLTTATNAASSSTWDLVYAQLQLLGLDQQQYNNALNRINALRSLSDVAITSIGKVDGAAKKAVEDQASALEDLLKYVEEMIKQEVKNQVKALEDQVDAYKEIVDLQKKSLELEKEKDNYTKTVSDKQKEIADLQKQIHALDLDDSREAAVKKAKLQEELSEKINDLADYQSDHAYDATSDMLDDMADSYEKEKQKEIDILENTISSEEKLYQLAIDRINNHWNTLYQDLINWNYEYGSVTNDEITKAWDAASAAVQQYGSYLNAILETQRQIASYESSSGSNVVGGSSGGKPQGGSAIGATGNYDTSGSQTLGQVKNIVHQMKENSAAHHSADAAGKARLNKANLDLGKQLTSLIGRTAVRGDDGVWYLDRVGGPKLYETYPYSVYHTGGIVGDEPTLKQKEIFAKLEKGEAVITEKQQEPLYRTLDFAETLLGKYGKLFNSFSGSDLAELKMQEQIKQDAKQAQAVVRQGGDTFNIDVPVQIYPAQKMDDAEIKQLTRKISQSTIQQITDSFIKRGHKSLGTTLKP
jgi:hypothetical protein